jgi:TfoX N-terminal domain
VAYDEALAERVRELLAIRSGVTERKMFGGVAWMLDGNMACGVAADELLVRVSPDERERALAEDHTRVFDLTGRPMRGFVCVTPAGVADDEGLASWVDLGADYAASLQPK